ncbi:MAG: hypothetical protein U1A78_27115 [Polyangia bacterium]
MLGAAAVGAVLSGCAVSPPVQPNGLPRVSRYTNSAQLDFMLSRYRTVAEQAASGTASPAGDLLEEACLGWERAVFDLQSARRYPGLLRLSTETANLAEVFRELPRLAQRSPRPEACGPISAPADDGRGGHDSAAVPAGRPPAAADATAAPAVTPTGDQAPGQAAQAAPAVAQAEGGATASSPPTAQAQLTTPAPVPMTSTRAESKAAAERRQLEQLRTALGMSIAPPQPFDAFADPTVPQPVGAPVDLATLRTLADSELPIVRLRARFHLLGLCTLAIEAADRFGQPTPGGAGVAAGKVGPTDASICGELQPGDTLRHAQRRLLASLLGAWRVKYPEPMTDLVVALANFASRDNPVVDGPRAAR